MTSSPTPTTHAAKAEAALRDELPNTATAHALLAVAEQLRIHNLIALASSNFPRVEIEVDDNIAPAEAADAVGVRAAVVVPRRIPDPREDEAGLDARTAVVAPRTMPEERADEDAETGLATPVAPPRTGMPREPV